MLTVSPAWKPAHETLSDVPTLPDIGLRTQVGPPPDEPDETRKLAEALPALVPPTPSTLYEPSLDGGTSKPAVALPKGEAAVLATSIEVGVPVYHLTVSASFA